METRIGNIIIGSSGGTAGGTANNYKIALPSSWVRQMGIPPDSRQVELSFDGTTITIARKQSLQEFLEANRHAGHKLYLLCCYSGDTLCAKIAADETAQKVCLENLVTDYLKLPFGNNQFPSWEDYLHFLEDAASPAAEWVCGNIWKPSEWTATRRWRSSRKPKGAWPRMICGSLWRKSYDRTAGI